MNTTKKYLIVGGGIFAMILFATLLPAFTWTLSPFYVLGTFFIIIGIFGSFIIDAWRGQSPQILTNVGHTSIRQNDIIVIPWQESGSKDERNTSLGSMKIALTGGFCVGLPWGISWPGSPESPVYIFPSIYCEKNQNDYDVKANLTLYDIKSLPTYLRDAMAGLNRLPDSRNRIHPTKTPIWYGTTSHMDGSATPENLKIERQKKLSNEELSEAEERQTRLYAVLRKQKEASAKSYIVGKPIEPLEDDK